MNTADARKMGETEQRIYCVSAWKECEFYTEAEKVALELTEHVTLIPTKRVTDELYQRVSEHYDEKQYVDLVLIINQINSWNSIFYCNGDWQLNKNNTQRTSYGCSFFYESYIACCISYMVRSWLEF